MTMTTKPEISGTVEDRTFEGPVVGDGKQTTESRYVMSSFEGQTYQLPAAPSEKVDQLRLLSLLARIRESRLSDRPDDADDSWETSQLVASLTAAQWEAVDKAQEPEG